MPQPARDAHPLTPEPLRILGTLDLLFGLVLLGTSLLGLAFLGLQGALLHSRSQNSALESRQRMHAPLAETRLTFARAPIVPRPDGPNVGREPP